MKRRTLTLTLCLFSLITLFSVGFAAWVIWADVSPAESEGNIIVDTVSDERVTLIAEILNHEGLNHGDIVFGTISDQEFEDVKSKTNFIDYRWLIDDKSGNSVPEQQLSTVCQLTIIGYQFIESISIQVEAVDLVAAGYKTANEKGYVGALPYETALTITSENLTGEDVVNEKFRQDNNITVSIDKEKDSAVIKFELKFTWGSKFIIPILGPNKNVDGEIIEGDYLDKDKNPIDTEAEGWEDKVQYVNVNPMIYFNSKNMLKNPEIGSEAEKILNEIYELLSGSKFKVKIIGAQKE